MKIDSDAYTDYTLASRLSGDKNYGWQVV